MKSIKKNFIGLFLLGSFIGLLTLLHAQDTASMVDTGTTVSVPETLSLTPTDIASFSSLSEAQMAALVGELDSIPTISATNFTEDVKGYYSLANPDWPPLPFNISGSAAWPLSNGCVLLNDINFDYQAAQSAKSTKSSSTMMSMSLDEAGDGTLTPLAVFDTNSLWLELTNVSAGTAYVNLHNGTNQVYAIWSSSDLTVPYTNWLVETEVFPTDTNCMPFTVSTLNRGILFLRAEDWTGVTHNGNTTPDWWFWEYFGTTALSDTNLDSYGNTLLSDYENGTDPNIISFMPVVANNYVNNMSVPVQFNILFGVPSYVAVSVDDTNYATDANWQAYTGTNITVNLGLTEGWHNVWIGLRGLPSNATQTWQFKRLKLVLTPPVLMITNPTTSTVSVPMIQVQGYCPEALSSISYDLTNATGMVTNQQVLVVNQFYSTNTFEFTTNTFQAFDILLTNGLNTFTFHATDLAGNTTTTNFSFSVDYSSKTNPPVVQIVWPQNGAQISGSNFTCRGWVSDPTATVAVQLVFTNGDTNVFAGGIYTNIYPGTVGRNGNFWLENLPLTAGTNMLPIVVTDVVGNSATTNITVVQSSLVLTMNPVSPDSQLWQPTVNLTGNISDATYAVWVNGVKGTNNGDGTWSANNVPVNTGGTANFDITGYAPSEQQPDGSFGN